MSSRLPPTREQNAGHIAMIHITNSIIDAHKQYLKEIGCYWQPTDESRLCWDLHDASGNKITVFDALALGGLEMVGSYDGDYWYESE